jgi:hypothetical protein
VSEKLGGTLNPALVLATVALVVALAGSAIAGQSSFAKITKSKVRNIAGKVVDNAAPNLSVASANRAGTADTAGIASNLFSANVAANGGMLGSIPTGATSQRTQTGFYTVDFGRPLNGCTISASLANNGPAAANTGSISAGVNSQGTQLQVVIVNDPGTANADRGFYAQIICPP